MLDFLGDLRRTHMCGTLRASDAGKSAVLMGWVNRRRDLGNLLFIDLRDRTGITQVVLNRELDAKAHDKANTLRNEYVIAVIGTVKGATPTPSIKIFLPEKSNWSPVRFAFSTNRSCRHSCRRTLRSPTKRRA